MNFTWSKLNPLNSIFGRLFLWFWLTAIVMIVCTAFTIRQLIKGPELQTIPSAEQQTLDSLATDLQQQFSNEELVPERARKQLTALTNKYKTDIVLFNKSNQQFSHSFQNLPERFQQRFRNISEADTPYGFLAGKRVFFGPVKVTLNKQDYFLFSGKDMRFPFLHKRGDLLLLVAIVVSGSLCFFLAWSFTRPIKHLRDASRAMAQGDIQAGTTQVTRRRKDEIGELSQEFRTMAVKVNELLEDQKRLLADISHELRSPLARLQLAIGIAQQSMEQEVQATDTPDNKANPQSLQWQQLERIEKEALQIDNMIGKVLTLSRLESSTQQMETQQLQFPDFLQSVLQDACYEANAQCKTIVQQYQKSLTLHADQCLIGSAVENVLRNSIKYAQSTIWISSKQIGTQLHIVIEDDGCGVPEEDLAKLFTPFYRTSVARNRESGGTGLGLAIAIQAVNAHNGNISASNSEKGGLSVAIVLPLPDSTRPVS